MKKLTVALLLGAFLLPLGVSAQEKEAIKTDNFVLNHMAIGVTAGLDGVGGQIAVPITKYLQVRAGYSVLPFNKTIKDISADDLPDKFVNDFDLQGKSIDIDGKLNIGVAKLLLDIFPDRRMGFHFTAGLHYGQSDFVTAETSPLPIDRNEWNSTYVTIAGKKIGTDPQGRVKATVQLPELKPYFGLGFGRAISVKADKRVTFNFDLGVIYTGGIDLLLYDLNGDAVNVTGEDLKNDLNWSSGDKLDTLLDFPMLPVMKFSLNVKLF